MVEVKEDPRLALYRLMGRGMTQAEKVADCRTLDELDDIRTGYRLAKLSIPDDIEELMQARTKAIVKVALR